MDCCTRRVDGPQSTTGHGRVQGLYSHFDKTIDFVVFKNEKGEAEIGVRVTRDAKGFSETPHKKLLHCLTLRDRAHEQPLLTVPMQF